MGSGADNAEADSKRHLEKKRSKDSKPIISLFADSVAGSTPSLDTTGSTPVVRAPETASSQIVDDTPVVADAPSPPTADAPVVTAPARSVTIDVQQPEVSTATPPHDPVAVVTTALSSAADVHSSTRSPGTTPTAPIESPVMWALAAAARRESLTSAPSLDRPAIFSIRMKRPWNPRCRHRPDAAAGMAAAAARRRAADRDPDCRGHPPDSGHWRRSAPAHRLPGAAGLPAGAPAPRDVKVISFDGTPIYVHFMPAHGLAERTDRRPTILNGPGWPFPARRTSTAHCSTRPHRRRRSGEYGDAAREPATTWSPGTLAVNGTRAVQLELNAAEYEGRDISAIINWIATQPEAHLDAPAWVDPRMGIAGYSYGGGIQLVAAANDHRVDAIVPTIT